MPDIRPDRMDETTPTDDELDALDAAGFETAKDFHDFGNGDLVTALRIGYKIGLADAVTPSCGVPGCTNLRSHRHTPINVVPPKPNDAETDE